MRPTLTGSPRIGDRVTVNGTETIYEGKSGKVEMIRTDGVYTHGVRLDGLEPHQARRWFSPGELKGKGLEK